MNELQLPSSLSFLSPREIQPHKCTHRDNESPHHTKAYGTGGYNGAFVECVERNMCSQNTTAWIESIPPYHPTTAHTLTSHPQTIPNRAEGDWGIALATQKTVRSRGLLLRFFCHFCTDFEGKCLLNKFKRYSLPKHLHSKVVLNLYEFLSLAKYKIYFGEW